MPSPPKVHKHNLAELFASSSDEEEEFGDDVWADTWSENPSLKGIMQDLPSTTANSKVQRSQGGSEGPLKTAGAASGVVRQGGSPQEGPCGGGGSCAGSSVAVAALQPSSSETSRDALLAVRLLQMQAEELLARAVEMQKKTALALSPNATDSASYTPRLRAQKKGKHRVGTAKPSSPQNGGGNRGSRIRGLGKLHRRIAHEVAFLRKLTSGKRRVEPVFARTSNLPFLASILGIVEREEARYPGSVLALFERVWYGGKGRAFWPHGGSRAAQQGPQEAQTVGAGSHKSKSKRCVVDIICRHGFVWVKVKALSASNTEGECENILARYGMGTMEREAGSTEGGGEEEGKLLEQEAYQGRPNIIRTISQLLDAALCKPMHFKTPSVVAWFCGRGGCSARVRAAVESMGAMVAEREVTDLQQGWENGSEAAVLDMAYRGVSSSPLTPSLSDASERPVDAPPSQQVVSAALPPEGAGSVPSVNLDVTTLIALVSDLTCMLLKKSQRRQMRDCAAQKDFDMLAGDEDWMVGGGTEAKNGEEGEEGEEAYVSYASPSVQAMAQEERTTRVLPLLRSFLRGKRLFVCETARKKYSSIMQVIGGPQEQARAKRLLARVSLVPDGPSPRISSMPTSGKVTIDNLVLFGTGEAIRATTTTANVSFLRACRNKGVELSAWVHPTRALGERKIVPFE